MSAALKSDETVSLARGGSENIVHRYTQWNANKKSMEPFADGWIGGVLEVYKDVFLLGYYDERAGIPARSSRDLVELFTTKRRREHAQHIMNTYKAGRFQGGLPNPAT